MRLFISSKVGLIMFECWAVRAREQSLKSITKKNLPSGDDKMQHCRTLLALMRIRLRSTASPIHFNVHIESS